MNVSKMLLVLIKLRKLLIFVNLLLPIYFHTATSGVVAIYLGNYLVLLYDQKNIFVLFLH